MGNNPHVKHYPKNQPAASRVSVDTLIPGLYFNAPVYLEKNYVLISQHNPVTRELIDRLKKWRYDTVYTRGKPAGRRKIITGTEMSDSTRTGHEKKDETVTNEAAGKLYIELLEFTRTLFNALSGKGNFDLELVKEIVKRTIKMVRADKTVALKALEMVYPVDNYLVCHSVNTAVLTICVADYLKYALPQVFRSGVSALLHDVGMLMIPENTYLTSHPLSEQERKIKIKHPILGYRTLKSQNVPDSFIAANLQHHERLDGSGYPMNLVGEKISTLAKIIGTVCSYEEITAKKPYKESLDNHNALTDIIKKDFSRYDRNVLKALAHCLSIYPVGTRVQLSNGEKAVVFKHNLKKPRYPMVKILEKESTEGPPIDTIVQTSDESGESGKIGIFIECELPPAGN